MHRKPTISAARLAANRANAQKSTGPRTEQGKARSSANSTTHGLTARAALLSSGESEIYQSFISAIVADLRPVGPVELEICRTVADGYWRIRQSAAMEQTMLMQPPEPAAAANAAPEPALATAARAFCNRSQSFSNLALYEQRIQRGIKTSMQELRRLQSDRETRFEREMADALEHYKHHIMQDLDFQPADHGFVFSFEEVDAALDLEILQRRVDFAVTAKFDLEKYLERYPPKAA